MLLFKKIFIIGYNAGISFKAENHRFLNSPSRLRVTYLDKVTTSILTVYIFGILPTAILIFERSTIILLIRILFKIHTHIYQYKLQPFIITTSSPYSTNPLYFSSFQIHLKKSFFLSLPILEGWLEVEGSAECQ